MRGEQQGLQWCLAGGGGEMLRAVLTNHSCPLHCQHPLLTPLSCCGAQEKAFAWAACTALGIVGVCPLLPGAVVEGERSGGSTGSGTTVLAVHPPCCGAGGQAEPAALLPKHAQGWAGSWQALVPPGRLQQAQDLGSSWGISTGSRTPKLTSPQAQIPPHSPGQASICPIPKSPSLALGGGTTQPSSPQ